MKNYQFLYILCFCLVSLNYGCEKAELQKSTPNDVEKITQRLVDECDDCPNMNDCCCAVEYVSGDPISLELCGTTDGDISTCTDEQVSCLTIDGRKSSAFPISSMFGRELFCMQENRSFVLKAVTVGNQGTTLKVYCQFGSLNPQSLNVTFTSPGARAFTTDDNCEIEQCFP